MNRLKQLRTEKNLKQDVLAKLLCMEVAGYSKLETNRVPLKDEYIIKLADFFDVSTDYLLGKSDVRNPTKEISENFSTVDVTGLNDEDVQDIQNQIDYKRWQKEHSNEKNGKSKDA